MDNNTGRPYQDTTPVKILRLSWAQTWKLDNWDCCVWKSDNERETEVDDCDVDDNNQCENLFTILRVFFSKIQH